MEPKPDSRAAEEKELTTPSPLQEKWIPTPQSFEKLLAAFDSDRDKAAKHYEKVRVKLVRYFERHGITDTDWCVDQTLDRVMRKLDEGEEITNIMAYIYGVASFVLKEGLKRQEQERLVASEAQRNAPVVIHPKDGLDSPLHICLDRCLGKLPIETRILIRDYYSEDGSAKIRLRKQMAQRLGIRLNALRIRAHKIRISLETCVRDCVSHFA
jgi:DNA-directed RNA polymerase specialized sigma24 family protein